MTVKQRKRNNKRKRVTKKLKGGGLFFKNDEQKKAELEKKKKEAIQLMKAICSRQELHNMMISTCTYLFDRYIYQDPKDPKDTEVTNEYPKPRLYKGDLIKLQKVIQKIVYKYNAILNKVFFTTDFEEKDTMIKNVKNIFYTKQQYDFFSKLKNLAADQTNKVSVPINTPIVTESAVEKIEETDSMINNHTEEQLNVNIEETANGKIEQEKTKDLQEETKEEQSQQSTNTLSNESIYKKKIYDNFFSPPLLDTTKQYEFQSKAIGFNIPIDNPSIPSSYNNIFQKVTYSHGNPPLPTTNNNVVRSTEIDSALKRAKEVLSSCNARDVTIKRSIDIDIPIPPLNRKMKTGSEDCKENVNIDYHQFKNRAARPPIVNEMVTKRMKISNSLNQ